ncbi:MAG: hypothetical protein ACLVAW_05850 [Eisenbergiella massiliensis]
MMEKLKVTIWSEGLDAELEPRAIALYPDDINHFLADFLEEEKDLEITVRSPDSMKMDCHRISLIIPMYWSGGVICMMIRFWKK